MMRIPVHEIAEHGKQISKQREQMGPMAPYTKGDFLARLKERHALSRNPKQLDVGQDPTATQGPRPLSADKVRHVDTTPKVSDGSGTAKAASKFIGRVQKVQEKGGEGSFLTRLADSYKDKDF
jgi:hypothetical protein